MLHTYPDRLSFAHLPTAVHPMPRLSDHLGGPRLLIKRDDQTGLALGGNKTRKLEFLLAEALDQGYDHVVTTGAPQSNHCRQTAAAAAYAGLGCTLVLRGRAPDRVTGNLLLDQLLGAEVVWAGDRPVEAVLAEVQAELGSAGKQSYLIPLGGSNATGAAGYVLAMEELMGQLEDPVEAIVFASSSGGTQAGLQLGAALHGYRGRLLAISIDHPAEVLKKAVKTLVEETADHLKLAKRPAISPILVDDNYLGGGYGVMGPAEKEAIDLTARLEGVLLDPVYTGRAMAGLIDLVRQGAFMAGQTVLFWHTGGTPALFAYADAWQ